MQHGWPALPSGLAYWKGWPYTLLAALTSSLFGLSSWALRVPSALAGSASVPLAWWGTRSILRRMNVSGWPAAAASLLAAYLMGFSAWCLLMSRWGRFYALGQTLFLAGLAVAAVGLSASGPLPRRTLAAFGVLLVVASTTFHAGALLLLALPAALAMGARLDRRDRA